MEHLLTQEAVEVMGWGDRLRFLSTLTLSTETPLLVKAQN